MLYHYDSLASTIDTAKELARTQPLPLTVIADRQTAGRGRLRRSFSSESGGLYFSYAFRPTCSLGQVPSLSLLGALALADALENLGCPRPDIKWPNDLLLQGKKICGILTEAADADGLFLVMGIGVNLTNPIPAELSQAGNLQALLGHAPTPECLAEALEQSLAAILRVPFETALDHYRHQCITLGHKVTVTTHDGIIRGTAVDIGSTGALLVETAPGQITVIQSGDATLSPEAETVPLPKNISYAAMYK